MKKYKIYKKVVREKIVCICLQSNKMCERLCEKDSMFYDQFRGYRECFKNKKEQLEDFGKRFIRYNTATEKGLLTVRKVTEIVNEMTGFNMIKGFTSKDVT